MTTNQAPQAAAPLATPDPTAVPDPTAPSARALRIIALCGLLALFVSFVLTAIVMLEDSIGDDGRAGAAIDAAFWALGLGTLAGLVAAVLPRPVLPHRARTYAVALQYMLALIAPVIAMMD
ncbi:hypothetical protein ABZ958_14440 [Streptomyces sp. NPDC046237]|uniref:hypothetical protein n=1 Tax=Streptomyces sp. NPDC046237 TaxID=3154914 RepID=UPI0033E66B3B